VTLRHLDAHDIDDNLDPVYSFCDIANLEGYRRCSRKRYAMISHALMDCANQVQYLRVVELETELARGVRPGAARFFHSLAQPKHNDFVSSGWLPSRRIFHSSDERLRGGERRQQEHDQCDTDARAALVACRGWWKRRKCSPSE
jgi:hypothetical protein